MSSTSRVPTSTPQVVTTPTQGTTLSSPPSSSPSTPSVSTDLPSTPSSASPTATPTSTPTSVASTTPTPTTPSTTSTTPQSTSVQSTNPGGQTTTTTPGGATTPSSSTTSTSSPTQVLSTSSYTTQVTTTYSTTNSVGSIIVVTTTAPAVLTTTISTSPSTTTSNSHIGTIVGAVVGGVGGIVIIVLLLLCIRRRTRKDEFDGNFDPDRVVGHTSGGGTLPHVDLADEVTPFPHPYTADGESSTMRQFGGSSYLPIPSLFSTNGQNSTEFYPSPKAAVVGVADPQFGSPRVGSPPSGVYLPPSDMYGAGSLGWSDPRVSPPQSTISHTTSSARGAKEREAMGRDGQGTGLGLATQQEAGEGSEDVVVHQDAGRAPVEDHPPPREIPPAYESIQHD